MFICCALVPTAFAPLITDDNKDAEEAQWNQAALHGVAQPSRYIIKDITLQTLVDFLIVYKA